MSDQLSQNKVHTNNTSALLAFGAADVKNSTWEEWQCLRLNRWNYYIVLKLVWWIWFFMQHCFSFSSWQSSKEGCPKRKKQGQKSQQKIQEKQAEPGRSRSRYRCVPTGAHSVSMLRLSLPLTGSLTYWQFIVLNLFFFLSLLLSGNFV